MALETESTVEVLYTVAAEVELEGAGIGAIVQQDITQITVAAEVAINDTLVETNIVALPGVQGDPGEGVPTGGTTGQFLGKDSGTDYDTSWKTITPALIGAEATGVAAGLVTAHNEAADPHTGLFDAAGAAATVAGNLSTHAALTGGSVHGLGTASLNDTGDFDLAGAASAVQANLDSHTGNTENPHSVTKAQVGLGSVPNTDCTTTANITDSVNKRFVTDLQFTTISNQSGTNTGDVVLAEDAAANGMTLAGQVIGIGLADGSHNGAISYTDWNTFNGKQAALGFTPVPDSRTVNGKALTADISLTYSDVGADANGAASTVQSNLTSHANATGTSVHGLGSMSTKADSDYVPFSNAASDLDLNARALKNFFISKTADTTAKMVFDVGALSAETTRTLTIRDASGTVALTSDLTSFLTPTTGLKLDQSTPQTFSGTGFTGNGLLKITSGTLGVDTNTYLTSLSGALLATGATTGATSQAQAFTNGVIAPKFYPSADSTTAVTITKANGTTDVLTVDTTNGRIGINTTGAPATALDIVSPGGTIPFQFWQKSDASGTPTLAQFYCGASSATQTAKFGITTAGTFVIRGNNGVQVNYGSSGVGTVGMALTTAGLIQFGSATGTAKLNVTGTSDIVTQAVQTFAGQTANALNVGNVSGGNYSSFEADGTLLFNGTATVFNDMLGDITRTKTSGTRCTINDTENTLDYTTAAVTTDYAFLNYQMPHLWKAGSNVYPHIHWQQAENNTPNWLLQYRWQRNGQAKTTAWTNYKCTTNAFTYTSGTLNQISYGAAVTPPSGYSLSDIIEVRVIRDTANTSTLFAGADPYTLTASVTSSDIHYEIDTCGSRTEYTK